MNKKNTYGLYLNLKILNTSQNQTFDINSENKEINTFLDQFNEINSGYLVLKEEKELILLQEQANFSNNNEIIISRIKKNNNNQRFELVLGFPRNRLALTLNTLDILNGKLWKALEYGNNNETYYLKENDLVNIGCLDYIIKEIHIRNGPKDDSTIKNSPIFNISPDYIKTNQCLNCKKSLIKLCKCEEYEHFSFIKENIKKNLEKNNDTEKSVITYSTKLYFCEKCKYICPIKFGLSENYNISEVEKDNEGFYELLEIEKPKFDNYLILESLGHFNKEKENLIDKYIYIIELKKGKDIKIGKGKEGKLEFYDNMEEEFCSLKFDEKLSIKNINNNYGVFILHKNAVKVEDKEIMLKVDKMLVYVKCMIKEEFDKIKNNNTQYPIKFIA